MTTRTAKLRLDAAGRGTVEIDGRELPGVRGLTLTAEYGHTPTLELDLALYDVSTVAEARIVIPDQTREALLALGWTPPDGEA